MALDVLRDCEFIGPALPEPFVQFELENELNKKKLLPKPSGVEGKELQGSWEAYRRKLRELVSRGGDIRVRNHVIEPLVNRLGYERFESADTVETREGRENGGFLLLNGQTSLRVWAAPFEEDLDAPAKRGLAYRFSHLRIAQRVLLAKGERVGLLTNGIELRFLLSDPARPDSQIVIPIESGWKRSRDVPDSYRLLLALASPEGIAFVPELVDKARLQQTKVTKELRVQARQAIERFVQCVLDHPANREKLAAYTDRQRLAKDLWHEGLITIYRILFILKLESTDDPARAFSFASTSLWRNTFSPTVALAPRVRAVLDKGADTGEFLEQGLRVLFRLFERGLECTELNVKPLGGVLFGENATPILSSLQWGELAVAQMLDRLLWTPKKRGSDSRERVHYGSLDVEDLGRVYEALLELEPGMTEEPMCRLRRAKLEVVVPVAQGEKYKPKLPLPFVGEGRGEGDEEEEPEVEEEEDEPPKRGKKTKVEWIEEIPPGRFYLRVGLGRKSSGSYYTPHSFVRFLVQETLGPQVEERSPSDDPKPIEILKLKVLDPAMGSGHFLVEACRFLGENLYEACRLCDERALAAERKAEEAKKKPDRESFEAEAQKYRERILALPDPDDELVRYLPSRAPEGEETGLSQRKALALCRRMIAVHCLYGVDKNPLAVELAKLTVWIESHAEGLPLTFMDHRLVVGDSLTGPFYHHLFKRPGTQQHIEGLWDQDLIPKFTQALRDAIRNVKLLEAHVGISLSQIEDKKRLKAEMDRKLAPFRALSAAWSGGVMLGKERSDDAAYEALLRSVADTGDLPDHLPLPLVGEGRGEGIGKEGLRSMLARGLGVEEEDIPETREALYALMEKGRAIPALPYELAFPEVFYPNGNPQGRRGFDAVLGNPPWDRIEVKEEEYWSRYDLEILAFTDKAARQPLIETIASLSAEASAGWDEINDSLQSELFIHDHLYEAQSAVIDGGATTGRPDLYRLFAERGHQILQNGGRLGWVLPAGFHANEGATGIRQLYLRQMQLLYCYSFENRRKLFEIDSRFKFATLVASRSGSTVEFKCGFYLHDDKWLFSKRNTREELTYKREFVEQTGGKYLAFPECRTQIQADLLGVVYSKDTVSLDDLLKRDEMDFSFGVELHRNPEFNGRLDNPGYGDDLRPDLRPLTSTLAPVMQGKSFWQFDDRGEYPVEAGAPYYALLQKEKWRPGVAFNRIAFREVAASTNERTLICAIVRPGFICNHTAGIEVTPHQRPNSLALTLLGLINSFFVDWQVRQKAGTHVSAYIFRSIRIPVQIAARSFFSHSALRLTCNHSGYDPLWREQVGEEWREGKAKYAWPALEGDDARWEVRAAIDAVVAEGYGLSRDQYAHVLSTFSHKSYPKAPALCLAKFDELKNIGLEAFTQKHDPYWDIPVNENLPEPVIDLPIPTESTDDRGNKMLEWG